MFRFFFTIFLISSAMTFAQNVTNSDSTELNHFIESFDAAWNMQNPKAFSSLWIADGDFITPWGRWIRGQGQIEKNYIQEKTGLFAKSSLQQTIDAMRFIGPQNAYVDTTMKFNGIVDPLGHIPPNLVLHGVYILAKIDKTWKIISLRIYQFQPTYIN